MTKSLSMPDLTWSPAMAPSLSPTWTPLIWTPVMTAEVAECLPCVLHTYCPIKTLECCYSKLHTLQGGETEAQLSCVTDTGCCSSVVSGTLNLFVFLADCTTVSVMWGLSTLNLSLRSNLAFSANLLHPSIVSETWSTQPPKEPLIHSTLVDQAPAVPQTLFLALGSSRSQLNILISTDFKF